MNVKDYQNEIGRGLEFDSVVVTHVRPIKGVITNATDKRLTVQLSEGFEKHKAGAIVDFSFDLIRNVKLVGKKTTPAKAVKQPAAPVEDVVVFPAEAPAKKTKQQSAAPAKKAASKKPAAKKSAAKKPTTKKGGKKK
jgi:hypothetical protein